MANDAAASGSKGDDDDKEKREREEKAKEAEHEAYFRLHPVTLDALFSCPDILEKIQRWFVSRGKNKYVSFCLWCVCVCVCAL
jgi:hypothetical protein